MHTNLLMQPTRPEAAQDEPISTPWSRGDSWFGRALNQLIPRFESLGASLVPGSIDPESRTFEVWNRGQRILVTPRANGDVHTRLADDGRPTSDQFPAYFGAAIGGEDRHPDLFDLDRIIANWQPIGIDD